jgi:thymidylate synthase
MMIAQVIDLEPGDFIITLGDSHIYLNHLDQVHRQLSRGTFPLPVMKINPDRKDLFSFVYEDFELQDYQHHAGIKAPIAI